MRKLTDTVAVVTGASSGIGRATALAFARKGATVGLLARRDDALEELADVCRDAGGAALVLDADVTDAEAVDAAAREIVGQFGRLDAWVNNAAVNLFARVEDAPVDDWHRVVETNLLGCYHGARAALPWLREQGSGVIVNVSSVLGKVGSPYQSAYVASKHGIRGLSAAQRQELRDVPSIRVCTVLPGPIDTPLFQTAANYTGWQPKPLEPVIAPERVARAVLRCVRRPTREVAVGWSSRATLAGARLAPGLTERIAARTIERDHFTAAQTAPSSGTLFEPDPEQGRVHGGWRNGSPVRKGALVAGAAVAAGAVVARVRR